MRGMANPDVYLYGQTVLSTIHKLAGKFPDIDGYGEISRSFLCPGGEAMNAAMLLSGLGLTTAIAGPHWGAETAAVLGRYAERYGIDTSGIVRDPGFAGVRDLIIVDDRHRTVFGSFGAYFAQEPPRWGEPDPAAIRAARVVAIDPFFRSSSVAAARFAVESGKPYITINCPLDGFLHRHAAANVVSGEFRRSAYAGIATETLLAGYAKSSDGLTIFTAGQGPILCARRGKPITTIEPCRVEAVSTLGAGDTFRAGVVFGIFQDWPDERTVRFASALAALLCTRLPIADNIPTLAEVSAFMAIVPTSRERSG